MLKLFFSFMFLLGIYTNLYAAVGCSLNDPDRDVKRIFPTSTGYLTKFVTLKETGGQVLSNEIEKKLGDKFDAIYENLDVPYAYYKVLKGKDVIGYIHGVNQKGKFGALQLIIATDAQEKIIVFYYQRITSLESANFRKAKFTDQFKGLSLSDFYAKAGRVAGITDPSINSSEDFKATLRGIKKNLILLNIFIIREKNKGVKNEPVK